MREDAMIEDLPVGSSASAGEGVPPGYKKTEVGVIPEEWTVRTLGDEIEKLEAGTSVNSMDQPENGSADQAILKTSSVSNGRFLPFESKAILSKELHRAKLSPRADAIIISRMNTPELVGESGYVERDYPNIFLPDRLWMTRFRAGTRVAARWLAYLLSYGQYRSAIKGAATGTSGSMKNISKESFLSITIPYPPFPEQRAIAAALSDADALTASLDKLIAKKRAMKAAAMQQLLTGQQRLPGFSGEWVDSKVYEFGDLIAGGTPSTSVREYWEGDIPWVTPTDIGNVMNIAHTERMITTRGLASIRRLPANSLLVTCIASIGKNVILRVAGACNQQIVAIVANNRNSTEFLYYLFERGKSYMIANAGVTATSIISKRAFSELEFRVPPIEEQRAIATVLSDMDAEITALEARRDKMRAIKQGMMQELLTGRTRLV